MQFGGNAMNRFITRTIAIAFGLAAASPAFALDTIRISVVPTSSSGPLYIAQDRGYFAAEGLTAEFANFDASQIVVQSVVAGDADIGDTALSAAFYNLAAKGSLKLIGGAAQEVPGFAGQGVVVSNKAWDAGLTAFKALGNHAVAIPQTGGPVHYSVALIADKYRVDMKTIRLLPLQTLPNVASAVAGGTADAGVLIANLALPLIDHNQAHLLGWVGDETPWQIAAIFVAAKTADQKRPMLEGFLRAYKKAAHDYDAAFTGPDGKRKDGPDAPAVLEILSKHIGQPAARIAPGIAHVDPDARLDVKDVLHQIDWFKTQGMVPADAKGEAMIDTRYAVALKK
jgi:NitT/TauT family transport system substrate-binding protein